MVSVSKFCGKFCGWADKGVKIRQGKRKRNSQRMAYP
jgi:hypothetical protein